MRRGFAAVLIAILVLSSTAAFSARRSVPSCCISAHGCKMQKRAVRTCAFASCDQSETATAAVKQPPATLTDLPIVAEQPSSTLHAATDLVTLPLCVASIDHPPRLLVA